MNEHRETPRSRSRTELTLLHELVQENPDFVRLVLNHEDASFICGLIERNRGKAGDYLRQLSGQDRRAA